MPLLVKQDGATVLHVLGERFNRNTGKSYKETKGAVYSKDDVLSTDDIHPAQLEKIQNGEDDRFEEISDKEAEKYQGGSQIADLSGTFQAEGGGPLDEPRKVQRGFTAQDLDREEYAEVVDQEAGDGDSAEETVSEESGSVKKSKTTRKKG